MRTLIIGDIHGCIEPFENLLQQLMPAKEDRIILLGDLFDRGPSSWEVFQKVKQLEKEFGDHFTLLLGNHDDYLLTKNMGLSLRRVWERVGRQATVDSFRAHGEWMEDAAPWLEKHCVLCWKEEAFQCVHAGLRNERIEDNDFYTLVHDHGVVRENTYTGKLTITGHIATDMPTWFKGNGETEMFGYGTVYPLPKTGVICIDTGCGKGGILTAMVIEDELCTFLYA